MIESINKISRTSRRLVQKLGRDPYPEEISEVLDMPVEKVKNILSISKGTRLPGQTHRPRQRRQHPGRLHRRPHHHQPGTPGGTLTAQKTDG